MLAKNILVPTDFSECATRALEYACELAQTLGATIHLVHCFGPSSPEMNMTLTAAMIDTLRSGAMAALEGIVAANTDTRFGRLALLRADPRDGILETARDLGCDLIVMGTHGRRGVSRILLGSVAEDVLRRAECPVLTLRGAS